MSKRICTIYGLKLKKSNEIRYIGQTVQLLKKRMSQHEHHIKDGNKLPLYNWMRKYHKTYEVVVLDDNAIFNKSEVKYIKYYREQGHRLLNCNDGGNGQHGFKVSKEVRDKISKSLTGRIGNTLGMKYSKEIRKNMSDAQKKYCSENGNSFKGKKHTKESKKLLSNSLKDKWKDSKYRKKNTENKIKAGKRRGKVMMVLDVESLVEH